MDFLMKRAWISIMVACLLAGTTPDALAEQGEKLWYPTGEPELGEAWSPERVNYRLLPWEEYTQHAEDFRKMKSMVPVDEPPKDSRPLQGCGINFSFGGLNRGFCVVGAEKTKFRVYPDTDADGSLRDEKAIELTRSGNLRTAEFRTAVTEKVDGENIQYPVKLRFLLVSTADSSESTLRYAVQPWTYRRGTIRLGDRDVPFELRGTSGIYDHASNAVWFDLDGNGQGGANYENRKSDEFFKVRDEHVNIGDASYRFEVDRFGRSLALVPLDKGLPERPSLDPGSKAPGFQAKAIDGESRTLGQYEDRVLLLDFWHTGCGPCIDEAPRLAQLQEQHEDNGLRILGVSPDSEENIREFTDRFDHDWPQVLESFEGPIHAKFRVFGYPTKFLIDREGRILCSRTGSGFWEECWPKAEERLSP